MSLYCGYERATRCRNGPQPGAQALMSWFLGAYRGQGGRNLGIYNCRTVRGGSTTSLHGEGRAVDLGINPHSAQYGTNIANILINNSKELGIQCVIWNRRIWSGTYCRSGWRNYSGVNPHVDHLHVELSWNAATTLTVARINQVLGGGTTPIPEEGDDEEMKRGDSGGQVAWLQRRLNYINRNQSGMKLTDDGQFGPTTEKVVKALQKRWDHSQTGRADVGLVGRIIDVELSDKLKG